MPSIRGISFNPASVAELPFTTCKYNGNITIAPNIPAPITKASAEVSEKVWFLNKRSGKIGSVALFSCHKNARVKNNPEAITAIVFESVQPFSGP